MLQQRIIKVSSESVKYSEKNARLKPFFYISYHRHFFRLDSAEGRGDLWLVAATGAALSVPYHLLLMSPTNPYLPGAGFSGAEAAAAASALGTPATADASSDPAILASHKLPGETEDVLPRYTNQRTTANIPNRRPLHGQLSYSPSGVLVPAEVASGSWTKRYWFGAALSMASFGAMIAILASKRDMAGFVAPF